MLDEDYNHDMFNSTGEITKTLTGPINYTEIVYALYSYSIAESIMQDVRDGKPVDLEAVAWASRFEFIPHIEVAITS